MTDGVKSGTWLRKSSGRTAEVPIEKLRSELEEVTRRDEFRHFAEYSTELVEWIVGHDSADLIASAEQWELERRRIEIQASARTTRRKSQTKAAAVCCVVVILGGLALTLAVGAAWIFDFGPAYGVSWLDSWWQLLLGTAAGLVLVVVGSWMCSMALEAHSFADHAYELDYATREWLLSRDVALSQTYRRAINQVLGPQGLVPFPEQAPDLIELTTDKIVPSQTIAYVTRFIAHHTSSAIGIAGPRGVGKSTLMAAVASEDNQVVIQISTSVKYEGLDFMRRLAFSIIDQTTRTADDFDYYRLRRSPLRRLMNAYALMAIGGFAIWADFTNVPLFTDIGALGVAGFAIVAAAFLGYFLTSAASRRPQLVRGHPARDLAQVLAADLQFEVAETTEQRATLSLSSFLGVERGSARTQTSRGLSYGDVTERVRRLLHQLGEEQSDFSGRVVVLIDELDKLPDVDSLIGTINSLKDLFHLPRVHFIVSVSDEALAAFELRGIQPRDAFDSSFDIIVQMERLSESEALEILTSRVAGFPSQLGTFCHVWSGGLPRDLIRGARACIDIFNQSERAETWQTTARAFLAGDLATRFQALSRTETKDGNRPDPAAMATVENWLATGIGADAVPQPAASPTPADAYLAFSACCVRALELVAAPADPSTLEKRDALCRAVAGISDGPMAIEVASEAVRMSFNEPESLPPEAELREG